MSEATHYWPGEAGTYDVWAVTDTSFSWEWNGRVWYDEEFDIEMTTDQMKSVGYLGVSREAKKPDNAAIAQQALDEWRACKQQPKAADWAYKWALTLCEIAGAR